VQTAATVGWKRRHDKELPAVLTDRPAGWTTVFASTNGEVRVLATEHGCGRPAPSG
jgi:hypothetical protein